jgi:peptidoglycan/xylan/chitin deacetylase (PgdA/CDA1 family)
VKSSRYSVLTSGSLKLVAHKMAVSMGIARLFRSSFRRRLLVLAYHGVCGEYANVNDPAGMHTPAPLFEAQLRALLDFYQPVSLSQVRGYFVDGTPLPDNPLLITSDDGYRNFLSNGLPILRSLKVPCAFFPIVGAVDTGEWPWFTRLAYHSKLDTGAFLRLCSELMLFSTSARSEWLRRNGFAADELPTCDHTICRWDELAEAVASGSIEIGSHTMTHPPLDICAMPELSYELEQARLLLEQKLNIRAEAVAYPFGQCSLTACGAAAAAGYKLGFLTDGRHLDSTDMMLAIPRFLVGRWDTPTVLLSRISGWTEILRV